MCGRVIIRDLLLGPYFFVNNLNNKNDTEFLEQNDEDLLDNLYIYTHKHIENRDPTELRILGIIA